MSIVCDPQIAREVLDAAARVIRPGITTDEIDAVVHEATVSAGVFPLGCYSNLLLFPSLSCAFVHSCLCFEKNFYIENLNLSVH